MASNASAPALPAAKDAKYTFGHAAPVVKLHGSRTATGQMGFLAPALAARQQAGTGLRVLDVGCGPGSITVDLLASGWIDASLPGTRVVGVEPEGSGASALAKARELAAQKVPDAVKAGVIAFVHGDAYKLSALLPENAQEDDKYDVVYCHQVLVHLARPAEAMRSMLSVLKKGGILAVREGDWDTIAIHPATPILERWHKVQRDIYTGNGANMTVGRQLAAVLRQACDAHEAPAPAAARLLQVSASPMLFTQWAASVGNEGQSAAVFGASFSGRMRMPAIRQDAVHLGVTAAGRETEHLFDEMSLAWEQWSKEPDAFFCMTNGEIIAEKL